MIDNLVRDLQVLGKANSLIGKIWLNVMVRRFGLFALASLVAVFGLGMANMAGFYALQSWGPVWAAAMIAGADLLLALIIVLMGRSIKPGPEIEFAFDVRKIEAIQTDSRDIKETVDLLGQQIRQTKDTIAGFVHHPLDTAAEHLLVPAVLSIVRGLRSKKE